MKVMFALVLQLVTLSAVLWFVYEATQHLLRRNKQNYLLHS